MFRILMLLCLFDASNVGGVRIGCWCFGANVFCFCVNSFHFRTFHFRKAFLTGLVCGGEREHYFSLLTVLVLGRKTQ